MVAQGGVQTDFDSFSMTGDLRRVFLPIIPKDCHPSLADVIFHNGTILTIETDLPEAQAIAIQGEKILTVGSDAEIQTLQGAQTQVVDLREGLARSCASGA